MRLVFWKKIKEEIILMITKDRVCPFTEKTFTPKTPEHYFISKEAFDDFVEETDPLEEFHPIKRKPNWSPQERVDPNTGARFIANHPAQKYATEDTIIKEKEPKTEEKKSARKYEPRVKDCKECNRPFVATKPAMRYCEECSPKGGKLVK